MQERRENLSYVFSIVSVSAILFLSLLFSNKYLTSASCRSQDPRACIQTSLGKNQLPASLSGSLDQLQAENFFQMVAPVEKNSSAESGQESSEIKVGSLNAGPRKRVLNWRLEVILGSSVLSLILLVVFFLAATVSAYGPLNLSLQKIELFSSSFVFALGLLIALAVINYGVFGSKLFEKRISLIFVTTSAALSLFVVSYGIFDYYYPQLADFSANFSPVTYPIVQEYLGKTLLIESKSHYGLHPYFMQLFLYVFPANVLTLSASLDFLALLSLASLALFLFGIIQNKLLALLGFIAVVFVQFFATGWWPEESAVTFQYESIRLLFPCLLLSFLLFFFRNPTSKKYYAGLIFFSYATLWNLDTGIPVFVTALVMTGYEKLKNDFRIKLVVTHLIQSFGILACVWSTLFLFLRLKSGQWPDLTLLTYGQSAALNFGYAMLPMQAVGIWWMPIFVYVIGLVTGINNFVTRQFTLQNSSALAATVLGVGLFTYFLGRSHDHNISHCAYPAIILLTIFADKFCKNFSKEDLTYFLPKNRTGLFLFSLPLLFISYLSSAFWFNLFSSPDLKEKFIIQKFSAESRKSKPDWALESDFIKQHINADSSFARDDILLLDLSDKEYFFSLELRAKSPLNMVNIRHMFYEEDLQGIHEVIKSAGKEWVILIPSRYKENFKLMSVEEVGDLQMLLTKHYHIHARMKIDKGDAVIIYKKLNS